jgi:hypothetical protein
MMNTEQDNLNLSNDSDIIKVNPTNESNTSIAPKPDQLTSVLSVIDATDLIEDLGTIQGDAGDIAALTLTNVPVSRQGEVSETDPFNIYSFDISSVGVINNPNYKTVNLSLRDISQGDDVDVSLYQDSNNNQTLDNGDTFLAQSIRGRDSDDFVNIRTPTASRYFAKVERYARGSSGSATYQLDISGVSSSDLFPEENPSMQWPILAKGDSPVTASGTLSNQNTSDIYRFSTPYKGFGAVNYSLRFDFSPGYALVEVIEDVNQNKILDDNDNRVVRTINNGSSSQTIGFYDYGSANYIVRVYDTSSTPTSPINYTVTLLPGTSFS